MLLCGRLANSERDMKFRSDTSDSAGSSEFADSCGREGVQVVTTNIVLSLRFHRES